VSWRKLAFIALASPALLVAGCASVTVDDVRWQDAQIDPDSEAVVVLGRHHSPEYETEDELLACIGDNLRQDIAGLSVIPAEQFTDQMYPWFEPRTAPLSLPKLLQTLDEPLVRERLEAQNVRYLVWVEGATETTRQRGSMACSIGIGLGGCFGFGMREEESTYEANIWDVAHAREVGRIGTEATGTSYIPAVVVPVPLIARVQSSACTGLAKQLADLFAPATEGD